MFLKERIISKEDGKTAKSRGAPPPPKILALLHSASISDSNLRWIEIYFLNLLNFIWKVSRCACRTNRVSHAYQPRFRRVLTQKIFT